jgi:hypothetical protein
MPQWLSLLIFYTTVIVVFASIIALVVACTTTQPQDKQSQTEHLPTGKIQPISLTTALDEWEESYRSQHGMKSPYRKQTGSGGTR